MARRTNTLQCSRKTNWWENRAASQRAVSVFWMILSRWLAGRLACIPSRKRCIMRDIQSKQQCQHLWPFLRLFAVFFCIFWNKLKCNSSGPNSIWIELLTLFVWDENFCISLHLQMCNKRFVVNKRKMNDEMNTISNAVTHKWHQLKQILFHFVNAAFLQILNRFSAHRRRQHNVSSAAAKDRTYKNNK